MKFINIPIFIISLALGIFVTYITAAPTKTILVYPNPENIDKILYKDKADNCFKYKAQEVKCPKDEKDIRSYNVQ
jgi:hypothetical protein